MSMKKSFARCVAASAALAGAVAIAGPGIAAADVSVPAPAVTAGAIGDQIQATVTAPDTDQAITCLPIVMSAADALPLAAMPMDQWPGFGDMLGLVYGVGSPAMPGGPAGTIDTTPSDSNTSMIKPITPGAYAVVGICVDSVAQDQVLSYNYRIVIVPAGIGSLGEAMNLGSAAVSMEGGLGVIMGMLTNGAGSALAFSSVE